MPQFAQPCRRQVLQQMTAALATGVIMQAPNTTRAAEAQPSDNWRYCLNTSTIRGQELSFPEKIDVIGQAGYQGIEPWMGEIKQHLEKGGKTSELRKQLDGYGLTVDSAIGFANWIVDDDAQRARGFEEMKRDMQIVAELGGTRIAAPPVGATNQSDLNLSKAAGRYHHLLELGEQTGVTPQLELWGFSKSLSRLGELMYVAVESGHPNACLLPDVYHIYKGGSSFHGLRLISGAPIHVIHMNDYPNMSRDKISDADRVYPGDGVAPIGQILRNLRDNGFQGVLSLELFNRDYWKQAPNQVARTGLAKMKKVVNESLSS
ncbi:MAG: sugar phosphate isomerase/epimerase [Planctomycetaceae bacterium]|nr:sugar phosphate isomerase/epimerase [Planctomycetaceae bacterium]